jgi:SpoIID/LytB domain protein
MRPLTEPPARPVSELDGVSPDAGAASDAGAAYSAVQAAALAALYSKRIDFRGGEPHLSIRLMEGREQVTFSARGRVRLRLAGPLEKTVEAPAGSVWTVRLNSGEPARLKLKVQLGEFRFADHSGPETEQRLWESRGYAVKTQTLGSVYGIAGKVIDNRRVLLLLDESFDAAGASQKRAELLQSFGATTTLLEEVDVPAVGVLELLDASGSAVALAQNSIAAETLDGTPFDVQQVEFGVGYAFHNFEDRSYRGSLQFTVDQNGKLAVVNFVELEQLLKGLVPSEIFARAHPEALKAQAVTARGEVLAKIGLKHLADPYLLCSEQHCAVYKGLSSEVESTNRAVEATRGEGLFAKDGRLVDSVYSAICGGHTEHNEFVWETPQDPSLRGKPDLLPGRKATVTPKSLSAFLSTEQPAACRLSTLAAPGKFRWEKRFTADEVNALTDHLKVGAVKAITVNTRGVSGRAIDVTISGEAGATQVRGELNIRRLFGMLNSAMFVVAPEHGANGAITGWVFRGGGWGHGVGMCQTGAIGRAEAGQSYREILRHYFGGAEVAPLY